MAYLAPIHRPSSVRHALRLNFLVREEECIVVAKANRLELYEQTKDGLALLHSKAIYGQVTMLHKLRPAASPTDHLFVGTDRFMYFTLSWDSEGKQLRTEKSYVDLADKTARDIQTRDRCHTDPSDRFMTLELYEGIITVVPIVQKRQKKGDADIGSLGDPVPYRIPELFVRSSAFLQTTSSKNDKPRLGLLYEDTSSKVRLQIREIDHTPGGGGGDPGSVEMNEINAYGEDLELGASHLIPVPAPAHGVVILGETSITYVDDADGDSMIKPLEEATIFVTWEQIDGQRFVIADDYGKLYLLMLMINEDNAVGDWRLDVLGETSRASVLVYLNAGYVFVGSHQGDSQVIKITEKGLEVVQSLSNIAPILDFTIMDMGSSSGEGQMNEFSSGAARIVTGSGAYKDGSLRSVRSGVGLEELGVLGEMANIADLFSIKSKSNVEQYDTLVVSFINETRIFQFDSDGNVEEVESIAGLITSQSTLLAVNLPNNRVLQIIGSTVRVSDSDSGMTNAEWTTPGGHNITAAAANERYAILSIGGTLLVTLALSGDLRVVSQKEFGTDKQIACVALPLTAEGPCVVGFWHDSSVMILDIERLETLYTESIIDRSVSVPRSLLIVNLLPEQPPTLFVGMADGTVITYTMNADNKSSLSGKKSIVLGTQQANFKALPRGDGLYSVFATCEHPSLIYGYEGRMVYSAVTAEKASCVCSFDSEAYPGALAIATPEDLKIATMDTERMTHVQTLPVHETVRRIAYSPELKAFGLGTIKRTLEHGVEVVQSHFKLTDEVLFRELDTWPLNEDELVESVMRAELNDGYGALAERFIVGTCYLEEGEAESVRGRILVFMVTEERTLKLIHETSVKGACRCLAMVEGKIVAALIKTIIIYSFEYETPSQPFLVKKASYRTSTAPIDLAVTGNLIAIADLMKSVSVVKYIPAQYGLPDLLGEVARHFQTAWGTAVAHVDQSTFLESDAEGNLMVLLQDIHGVTPDDRRRLQVTSEIRLGEMVNRIRRIDVPTLPDAVIIPRAFLATVEGSIYLFGLITEKYRDLLMRLQANMAEFVHSPGNVPFNKYRAFKNQVREAEEPFRFVDGELVERFLDCSTDMQERMVEGLATDAESVRLMVESLKRLH